MKQAKVLTAVLLLAAFLLSSCAMGAPNAKEVPVEPAVEMIPQVRAEEPAAVEAAPLADAAESGYFLQPLAVNGGVDAVTADAKPLFKAKFEGDRVEGSGEAVDGVYRFTAAKTDGEAWHVKLESNYPTVAGRDYQVTYRFTSDVAGKVKFGDFQEFEIQKGENSVTGMLIATGGTSYLDLQLGMLPPFTIEFSEIEIEEFADEVEYEDALPRAIDFENEAKVYEKHDQGYAPIPTRSKDDVSIYYFSSSWEPGVWKSRLYVKTGLIPESGVRYHVTADVESDMDMPFEILFNDGEVEKGYGALYGQNLTAGEKKTCEAVITGGSEGEELVLQFSLGEAPEDANVKVGNVRIETVTDHYKNILPAGFALDKEVFTGRTLTSLVPTSYKNVPLNVSYSGSETVREFHDPDFEASLEKAADSATYRITRARESNRGVWEAKLFVDTGFTPVPGKLYEVKFDLDSEKDQEKYEICFDGAGGDNENYGAIKPELPDSLKLKAGQRSSVDYLFSTDADHGPLTIRIQLGETNTAEGNTVKISGLELREISSTGTELTLPGFGYPNFQAGDKQYNSFDLENNAGAKAVLGGNGSFATARIEQSGDDWHIKLYGFPGVMLEDGKTYRVSMDVENAEGCSVAFKNESFLSKEDAFGSATVTGGKVVHTITPSGTENNQAGVMQFLIKIGNLPNGTEVKVSNVKVELVEVETTNIATTEPGYGMDENPANKHVVSSFSENTAKIDARWDDWHIKLYAIPPAENKAITNGQSYTISMDVAGADGCAVCFNREGGGETDFGSTTVSGGKVQYSGTATMDGNLEIILKLGTLPAGSNVTVSNVSVNGSDPLNCNFFVPAPPEGNDIGFDFNGGDGVPSATLAVNSKGCDWHAKYYVKPGVTLEAGKTYTVKMDVTNADGCPVVFKNLSYTEKEDAFGSTTVSNGKFSYTIAPTESGERQTGEMEILFKLGTLPAGTEVTVSNLQILTAADQPTYTDLTPKSFKYPVVTEDVGDTNSFLLETNKGTVGELSGDGSSATAHITKPGDDWHIKLYAKTGLTLEAGKTYEISMDVANADGCMACFKDLATDNEEGFGSKAVSSGSVSHQVSPATSGELEILLKLGTVPADTDVKVSNVKVSELSLTPGENLLSGFQYNAVGSVSDATDDGYITSLEKKSDSAVFHIHQAPAEERHPWNVKLNVKTGFTPENGKGYRVSFDLAAEKPQAVAEVFYDGNKENAYGQLFNRSLSAGTQNISYTIRPGESNGELTLQIRLGQTDGTDGNTYTVSNVKIEEVTFTSYSTPEKRETTTLRTEAGYRSQLDKTADRATVRIEKTPSTGLEAWKNKLFVETGVTLKAGQKYRIRMDVKSIIPAPFEVCFNNGGEEKGLGAMFGLMSSPSGQPVEYVTYPRQDIQLVIQLSLGNCTSPNSIVLSNLAVEKAGTINLVSDTIYEF